ncbi:DUF333 domain-containing protein [Yersinia pseudotuberculosis]|uniref:DUF333 domain-containing protein n=2 Tax=Yersinia pseudotuberculosis TaxID=633 RepID=A0ABM7AKI8_YERPU|nr:DUF333 domain-containing protein [Yersinia pseudotuberculosis]AYW87895.1 DUF333 domain-containing protein [Yersinia pseudotuberculosis]AYW93036.1 DUF333 domain-containing protein [Yersinia pseudotuberculosis]AYW98641.1 DUF333 domain-containing protein [Yersinia pseudotuberculosis]AZA30203.1 DUF333 domain-containing protein [Yersinia pseudotuberculosis]MBK1425019.1 DUF333 domain-containing protein [Yersinia pseudotuberculosis]
MRIFQGVVCGMALFLAACSSNDSNINTLNNSKTYEPEQQATNAIAYRNVNMSNDVNMSNSAAANCANAGGILANTRQLHGGSVGMCQLPDGKRCDEEALLRGACPVR